MFSKSCILENCLKQRSYRAIRKMIILKWYFLILNIILHFLMLTNISQFHLSNCQGMWSVCAISVFVLHRITLSVHSHSYESLILFIAWNLPYYLHFAFCLLVWLIKFKCTPHPSHYEKYFRESYWGAARGILKPWITGGPKYIYIIYIL